LFFNLKWSAVAGCAGLILSLLVGALSGAGFPWLLVRALIFGGIFFVFGNGVWLLINNFIPELLFPDNSGDSGEEIDNSLPSPGSRVNITVEDDKIPAEASPLPQMLRNLGKDDAVGDISFLFSNVMSSGSGREEASETAGPEASPAVPSGIDQGAGDGYNRTMEVSASGEKTGNSGFAETYAGSGDSGKPGDGGTPGAQAETLGDLPDLDAMAGSFLGPAATEGDNTGSGEGLADISSFPDEAPRPPARKAGNKSQPLKGDFNPQELAAGIRTVLNNDNK
jgi:hypothetical protein